MSSTYVRPSERFAHIPSVMDGYTPQVDRWMQEVDTFLPVKFDGKSVEMTVDNAHKRARKQVAKSRTVARKRARAAKQSR